MFRNKKVIEIIKNKVYLLVVENLKLITKLECVEKNTKALFEEYVIGANNLVCPICGDKVHIVIDDRFKSVFGNPSIEDNGTFVYKIKCNKHCVGVRDESILGAIEKFKSLKIGGDKDGTGKD